MTLVLDASAVVEYLLGSEPGQRIGARMAQDGDLNVPHLTGVEVASALRTAAMARSIDLATARFAIDGFRDLPASRWPVEPLLPRVWELRGNFTAYDAVYVALAEALPGVLVTTDAKLASAAQAFSDVAVELL
jgi:predicted nucleic acid-binding protein